MGKKLKNVYNIGNLKVNDSNKIAEDKKSKTKKSIPVFSIMKRKPDCEDEVDVIEVKYFMLNRLFLQSSTNLEKTLQEFST